MLSFHRNIPANRDLSEYLTTPTRRVKVIYPVVRVGYWTIWYQPDYTYEGISLPWHGEAGSKKCNMKTLEMLLQLIREEE